VAALLLIPAIPLLGALILSVFGGLMPRRAAGAVGCSSIGLSFASAIVVASSYFAHQPAGDFYREHVYEWLRVGALRVPIGLYLDPLSLVMIGVVTFVGLMIHIYSAEFMDRDADYARFFAYMNLFVGMMLILVTADNLLFLFLGWEGVGLCSYLLIGFWYQDAANGRAAQKAFIVTRIGDAALAVGLFVLFWHTGTFDLQQILGQFSGGGEAVRGIATIAALLIAVGAIAKSAQLPLQTWLPDAMAGPTPVSALIHAATMVTAGVYLIARTHGIFEAAPGTMLLVAVIGAATACYGGLCALAQRDIKRILAYSTISQIGYMFLALGVGVWWAAIFHLVTHAFFKALLFLSAGVVIQAMDEDHDISHMGGLFGKVPTAGWTFLIGACSLSALPLVTAGFYSKDAILWGAWSSPQGGTVLWAAGLLAAVLTGVYIFRPFIIVFLGPSEKEIGRRPRFLVKLALFVLAFFAITAGILGVPVPLANFAPLREFLGAIFGLRAEATAGLQAVLLGISAFASLLGIGLAAMLFSARPSLAGSTYEAARRFLLGGMGFDWVYDRVIVRPYVSAARALREDVVDRVFDGLAIFVGFLGWAMSATQTGRVRNYATGLALGAVVVAFVLIFGR